MSDHTSAAFDRELDELGRCIAEMGGVASGMVSDAALAVASADGGLALAVVERDHHLNALQRKVEQLAVLTIARRQPVARTCAKSSGRCAWLETWSGSAISQRTSPIAR